MTLLPNVHIQWTSPGLGFVLNPVFKSKSATQGNIFYHPLPPGGHKHKLFDLEL